MLPIKPELKQLRSAATTLKPSGAWAFGGGGGGGGFIVIFYRKFPEITGSWLKFTGK